MTLPINKIMEDPPKYNPKAKSFLAKRKLTPDQQTTVASNVLTKHQITPSNLPHSPPTDVAKASVNFDTKKPLEEGFEEATKEEVKEDVKGTRKLDELVLSAREPLMKLSGVFPFDFFPDEISIEISQVNVVYKYLLSDRRQSIVYDDMSDVLLDRTILFASLTIVDKHFIQNTVKVNFLKNDEAVKARRLMQGLIVAHREGVDLTSMTNEEILDKIESIGKIHGVEKEK